MSVNTVLSLYIFLEEANTWLSGKNWKTRSNFLYCDTMYITHTFTVSSLAFRGNWYYWSVQVAQKYLWKSCKYCKWSCHSDLCCQDFPKLPHFTGVVRTEGISGGTSISPHNNLMQKKKNNNRYYKPAKKQIKVHSTTMPQQDYVTVYLWRLLAE